MKPMKKILLLITASILIVLSVQAQKTYTVTINITRISTMGAPLIIELYSDETSFNAKHSLDSLHIIPEKDSIQVSFQHVPAGTYAVAMFQDIDGTGKLTTKEFGIPAEPVGISNYPLSGIPQPPKFKKATFDVSQDTTIHIPLMFSKDYVKEIEKL